MMWTSKTRLRIKAEQIPCPFCKAEPHMPCIGANGLEMELVLHYQRYEAAKAQLDQEAVPNQPTQEKV